MNQTRLSRLFVTGKLPVTNFLFQRALLALAIGVISACVVLFQYFLSPKGMPRGGGFVRSFHSAFVIRKDSIALSGRHYYAGADEHHFYLGRWHKSAVLQVTPLLDTTAIPLTFPPPRSVYKFTIDSSLIFAEEMGYDRLLADSFPPTGQPHTVLQGIPLLDVIALNARDVALVTLDEGDHAFELAKMRGRHLDRRPGLLRKQVDGKFCVDGMFRYDKQSKMLVYLYYYRNQYLVLDTGMNLLYEGHTIDTTRHADIRVAHLSSGNMYYLSSPARVVNKRAHVSGGWLYVRSMVQADNESDGTFRHNMVLDVYRLTDGSYQFSFYLPKRNGREATEFWVINETFCVLYRDQLNLYSITPQGHRP